MRCFAVIDTNVLVSALLTKNIEAATFKLMKYMFSGVLTPLYCKDIIREYKDVLNRPKFKFDSNTVIVLIERIMKGGIETTPASTEECFIDETDAVFYQVALTAQDRGANLVTGNLRHFPLTSFVVSPAEMLQIIETDRT